MTFRSLSVLSVVVLALAAVAIAQDRSIQGQKGGSDLSGPYEVVANWPQPPPFQGMAWGRTPTVFAESPNRVFVMESGLVPISWKVAHTGDAVPARAGNEATHCASTFERKYTCKPGENVLVEKKDGKAIPGARWDHTLMIFDANGKMIESWEQHNHLFTHPHSVLLNPYDPERNVWVIDDESEQIFKFTKDGKLLMTLGEFRVARSDRTHFGGPSGIVWLPNGDFYVSDGYKNARVVKYSKDGKYLMEWGKPGKGPGEFNLPHTIAIDAQNRLYVSDRLNGRIQIFDLNGKYLDEWTGFGRLNAVAVSKDQYLWAADGMYNKILKFDLNGKLLDAWGTFGVEPGQMWSPHTFNVDSEGSLYLAEGFGGRVQKFRPRKGADPKRLIGPLMNGLN